MATRSSSTEDNIPEIAILDLVPSAPPVSARGSGECVLGMLISDKPIKNNVIKNVLKEAWSRFGKVRMVEVNQSTLVFEFDSAQDKEQILELSPGSVHGYCMNLRDCPANMSVTEVDFNRVQVWAQTHGLSMEMINNQNAECIGEALADSSKQRRCEQCICEPSLGCKSMWIWPSHYCQDSNG